MFEATFYPETARASDLIDDEVAAFEAELDAEEALAQRILAEWASRPVELPSNLESLPADFRLAEALCAYEPDELSDADRVRYLKASERMVSAFQGRTLQAINSVHDSYKALELEDAKHAYDGTTFELRGALRWTRRAAESELDFATDLLIRLPVG